MNTQHDRLGLILRAFAGAVIGLHVAAYADDPKRTITINFDSTAEFEESDGKKGTAKASTLTADQKAKVVERVKEIYKDAVGERKVEVKAGSGGDVEIIVSSGDVADEKKYGNAGKPGKPGVCYEDQIDDTHAGDALVNAIANVVAHEAGHKFGLGHNCDDRPSIMTSGKKWETAEVAGTDAKFNTDDKGDLMEEICDDEEDDSEHSDDFCPGSLGVYPGDVLEPESLFYEEYLDVQIVPSFVPPNTQIGYISHDGYFIAPWDPSDQQQTLMTFPYHAGANIAIRVNGQVYSLCDGAGGYELFEPNPFNPSVAMAADVFMDTDFGPANFQLFVIPIEGPQTGGFYTPVAGCYADCDGDGQLTILDFICYQNLFQSGDQAADCNGDNQLNILDFVCFQNAFQAGC